MGDFSNYFISLYQTVLEKERKQFNVRDESVRNAIQVMKDAYLPDPHWKSKSIYDLNKTNYNEPAFRCAYIHKYAMCYTGMVCHLLQMALEKSNKVRANFNQVKKLRLCSLGGGPGTDIIGLLAALVSRNQEMVPWSATVIDIDEKWKVSFDFILSELKYGNNAPLQKLVSKIDSYPYYSKADLLDEGDFSRYAKPTIETSDVILMVKFVSAAACNYRSERMVEKIFRSMKSGAMLIFIDNAGGGFDKMMKEKADENGLSSIYGPLRHYDYEEPKFSLNRFGYTSQSKSKVVFEVYQKPQSIYAIQIESEEIFEHTQRYVYTPDRSFTSTHESDSLEVQEPVNPYKKFAYIVIFVIILVIIIKIWIK